MSLSSFLHESSMLIVSSLSHAYIAYGVDVEHILADWLCGAWSKNPGPNGLLIIHIFKT